MSRMFVFADAFSQLMESVTRTHSATTNLFLKGITYLLVKWFKMNSEQDSVQYIHSLLREWDSSLLMESVWPNLTILPPDIYRLIRLIDDKEGPWSSYLGFDNDSPCLMRKERKQNILYLKLFLLRTTCLVFLNTVGISLSPWLEIQLICWIYPLNTRFDYPTTQYLHPNI